MASIVISIPARVSLSTQERLWLPILFIFASYKCWSGVLSSMTLIEQEQTLIPEVLSVRCPAQTSGPNKHTLTLILTTITEDTNVAEREKKKTTKSQEFG